MIDEQRALDLKIELALELIEKGHDLNKTFKADVVDTIVKTLAEKMSRRDGKPGDGVNTGGKQKMTSKWCADMSRPS